LRLEQNKGVFLGICCGLTVFILALILIMYNNSDFDQQLIQQVDSGVPADKLLPQIDQETKKMNSKADNYQANIINKNLKQQDVVSYQKDYEAEKKIISQYNDARVKFAKREINKDEFLKEIQTPKYAMETLYK
jgi:hypothetical protein